MRSWNKTKWLLSASQPQLFAIYQWGVETNNILWCLLVRNEVRNLPMRSWNEFCQSSNSPPHKSSQFTNEELKPNSDEINRLKIQSSQFTNEELKLISSIFLVSTFIKFAIYQWGVETTFLYVRVKIEGICSQFTNEELKLSSIIESAKALASSQFTNEELKLGKVFGHRTDAGWFAIYQWGVETF